VSEPRTHYQLSFTGKQAMLFFVVCLFGLGLSFFFGLMTGLSGHPEVPVATGQPAPTREAAAAPTPAEAADEGEVPAPSEAGGQAPAIPEAEATPPATLQAFEDRIPSEPTPPSPAPAGRAPAESVWVQVASLTSRPEADALAGRLSRRGYHAQIATASGPKGRVFRVRVGPYRSDEEAGRMAERLRRQERIPQTWIVREGT
jgi:cell division septation protein DedD